MSTQIEWKGDLEAFLKRARSEVFADTVAGRIPTKAAVKETTLALDATGAKQAKQEKATVPDKLHGKLVAPDDSRPLRRPKRKAEAKTAGKGWFDLPATPLTPEIKDDLRVIAMRAYLDPKRFYKKDTRRHKFPKYFQIGRVVEGPAEFYSSRISRKQRTANFVQEIMRTTKHKGFLKRKFKELQAKKAGKRRKRTKKRQRK